MLIFVAVVARGPSDPNEAKDYQELCKSAQTVTGRLLRVERIRREKGNLDHARAYQETAYSHLESHYKPRLKNYCEDYPHSPLRKFLRFMAWVDEFRPYSSGVR
jgi:hypothetical protein